MTKFNFKSWLLPIVAVSFTTMVAVCNAQPAGQPVPKKSATELQQEKLDKEEYQQPEAVHRDVPDPDDLFSD